MQQKYNAPKTPITELGPFELIARVRRAIYTRAAIVSEGYTEAFVQERFGGDWDSFISALATPSLFVLDEGEGEIYRQTVCPCGSGYSWFDCGCSIADRIMSEE